MLCWRVSDGALGLGFLDSNFCFIPDTLAVESLNRLAYEETYLRDEHTETNRKMEKKDFECGWFLLCVPFSCLGQMTVPACPGSSNIPWGTFLV